MRLGYTGTRVPCYSSCSEKVRYFYLLPSVHHQNLGLLLSIIIIGRVVHFECRGLMHLGYTGARVPCRYSSVPSLHHQHLGLLSSTIIILRVMCLI